MKKITSTFLALMPMALCAQSPISHSSNDGFGYVLMILLIFFIVFIICRELICWYYKINKMVKNQDEVIRLLKKIANESDGSSNDNELKGKKKSVTKELADSAKFMVTGK